MGTTHILESPLFIPTPTKKLPNKRFYFNLNNYRNVAGIGRRGTTILNQYKIAYKALMSAQVLELPKMELIHVTYTVYAKDRRLFDVGNVCSIHDKFFQDALTELGIIPDDNYTYAPEVVYRFGEVRKDHPHVQIMIKDLSHANRRDC